MNQNERMKGEEGMTSLMRGYSQLPLHEKHAELFKKDGEVFKKPPNLF
ncbi:hypothetical protein [uncultured Phocaeicola sp.]|jgi:hypothetical protein|nr:hypothetical protein [uncultured Phocaeicola sp.]